MSERSVFLAALGIEDPAERVAYLDEECRDDPDLRRRVEDLLRAHREPGEFMDRPPDPPPPGPTAGPAGGPAGMLLAGRYRLGEEIGRGGMGTVYRAEQLEPVRRPVAIKVINPGMDSRPVLHRFEAERQALAVMDHPHIARVLDAGAAGDGRPFFVMELVDGVSLTEYCDGRKLPVAERLGLFRQVCGAVQHAHQKGVIHRDIKPSNVLVEEHDGVPSPKVIDFGLAKAIAGPTPADQTLFTAPGMVAGTPLYMAPEQAGPDARDVDTRADVYALGAVLYELLTGSPPFGREALRRAAFDEVLRVIREDDPPTPSSRLGSAVDLPAVAACRGTEPSRLGRFVRGDLDRVAMKALAKDRGRRYESAAALGADVDRFLNHEPVAAGPPGLRYRALKFARRNRAAVAAAAIVLVALVLGIAGTTYGLVEARTQRDAADLARRAESERAEGERRARVEAQAAAGRERAARQAEAVQRRVAVEEAENAAAVRDFLLRDLLLQSAPALQLGPDAPDREVKVRTLLDRAAARLPGPFRGRPFLEGSIRSAVGQAYLHLGAFDQAGAQLGAASDLLARSRGPAHPDTLRAGMELASIDIERGEFSAARRRLADLLPIARGAPDLPPDLLVDLLLLLARPGQYQNRPAEAEPYLAEAGTLAARLDADHPSAFMYRYQAAFNLFLARRYAECEALASAALTRARTAHGDEHPMALALAGQVAMSLSRQGKHEEAIGRWRELGDAFAKVHGPEHPSALEARFSLARALQDGGKLDEAEGIYRAVLAARERAWGPDHLETIGTLGYLAETLRSAGRFADAEPLYRRAWDAQRARYGPGTRPAATLGSALGACLIRLGRYADAEAPLRDSLASFEKAEADAPRAALARARLGAALLGQRKYAEAEPFLIAGHAGPNARMHSLPPPRWSAEDRAAAAEAAEGLIALYEATGRPDEARKWRSATAQSPAPAPPR